MDIRKFQESDINKVIDLFYDTVHTINRVDYTSEQLAAWANPLERDKKVSDWLHTLSSNHTYVAEQDNTIIGFVDLTNDGLLDRLYVHKDFQRQGIASALFNVIVQVAKDLQLNEMNVEASITAKPFFLSKGFKEVQKQQIEKHGIIMNNYLMNLQLEHIMNDSISEPLET